MSNSVRICPICKRQYNRPPALSRVDNKTKICPACGVMQALGDYINNVFLKTGGEEDDAKCGQ